MKRLAILLLSLILVISAAACSRKQSEEDKKVSKEKFQINQIKNVNQKPSESISEDEKSALEQTEKVNTEVTNLSNEIEKVLNSLDDIDESKLNF